MEISMHIEMRIICVFNKILAYRPIRIDISMHVGIFQYQFSIFGMHRNSHAKNDEWLAVRQGCCGLTIVYTGSKGNVPPLHLLSLVSLVRAPSQDSPMCVPVCMSTLYQLLGSTPRDQPNTQSQVNYV